MKRILLPKMRWGDLWDYATRKRSVCRRRKPPGLQRQTKDESWCSGGPTDASGDLIRGLVILRDLGWLTGVNMLPKASLRAWCCCIDFWVTGMGSDWRRCT
jgi:hypothetical protein